MRFKATRKIIRKKIEFEKQNWKNHMRAQSIIRTCDLRWRENKIESKWPGKEIINLKNEFEKIHMYIKPIIRTCDLRRPGKITLKMSDPKKQKKSK